MAANVGIGGPSIKGKVLCAAGRRSAAGYGIRTVKLIKPPDRPDKRG
jgi:hypothetical protein